jgi:branched-subunit amino acid transport protein
MTLWLAIGAVAVLSFACKAFGPALFGGRTLPARTREVIALTAPALLAGFVVVDVLGPRWSTVLARCRAPLPVSLAAAVAVTALLRM